MTASPALPFDASLREDVQHIYTRLLQFQREEDTALPCVNIFSAWSYEDDTLPDLYRCFCDGCLKGRAPSTHETFEKRMTALGFRLHVVQPDIAPVPNPTKFTILPVFTSPTPYRSPYRPWRTVSHNTSKASSRRLLGKNGDAWSDIPSRITSVEYKDEWIRKYTTGKDGTFKKFSRPKFQHAQHSHGFGKPTSAPAPTPEDYESRAEDAGEGIDPDTGEGIDPDIQDGVYASDWSAPSAWGGTDDPPAAAEPSYETDFNSENHIPTPLPVVDEQTPRPQARPWLEQRTWGIAEFDIERPTSSEMKEWEAKLRDAMEKDGEKYYPPEIARSRIINFNRETTRLTPSPRTPDENRLKVTIDVNNPIPEKVLWERGIRASWSTDDLSESYDDGVYMLVERRNQPPRVYFLTHGSDPITYGDQSCCPLDADTYRAARRYLYADKGIHPLAKGHIRHLCFTRTGGPLSELVVTLSGIYVTDLMTRKQVDVHKLQRDNELTTTLKSVEKTACV